MTYRFTLLAGAGVAALALATAPADAATKHKPAHRAATGGGQAEEIKLLREEVEALKARLDAQEQAQLATESQAQDASTAAATAATQAQAAQTQAAAAQAAVPAEVKTQVASLPKPKGGWFDNTSISGRSFFNVSHITQKSDGQTVGKSTAYDIKRFYLGVDHKFNDVFSANLTTDINLIGNTNTVTGTANTAAVAAPGVLPPGQSSTAPTAFPKTIGETLFVKKAYLQAKLNPAFTVRVGSADLPWVPFAEDLYGFRYVENTLIDRSSFGTSADWGVHAFGSFGKTAVLSYAVSAIDGAGFRNPIRSKTIDIEGRVSLAYKGFTVGVGGYTGKRAQNTDTPYSPTNNATIPVQTDPTPAAGTGMGTAVGNVQTMHTAQRFDAIAAYVNPRFRLGVEYFYAKNWNRVTQVTEDKSDGVSGFGSFNVTKLVTVFGRYDYIRPTKDLFPRIKDNYFNVGIQYEPTKIVDLALVYKRDRVDHGYFSPTNSNPSNFAFPIGGRNDGTYSEIGVWGQFRF